MPTQKVRGGAYQNVDEVSLNETSPALIDGYVDEFNNTVKRPGLALFYDLTTDKPSTGMFIDYVGQKILVTNDESLFTMDYNGDALADVTGTAVISKTIPALFAADGSYIWGATGGALFIYNVGAGTTAKVTAANSPSAATHVAYLDGYILALDGNDAKFAGPVDRTVWNALDYFQAETNPDATLALTVFNSEVVLLGRATLEFFRNDGTTPFSWVFTLEHGIAGAYAYAKANGFLFVLTSDRQLIKTDGRNTLPVSNPFQKVISGLNVVSDCILYPLATAGRQWIVLQFPTENLTLVYDVKTNQWQQWGNWNETTETYSRFKGHLAVQTDLTVGVNAPVLWASSSLVCDKTDGRLYKADVASYSDDGETIRTLRRTGNFTYQTLRTKRVKTLAIRASTPAAEKSRREWRTMLGAWTDQAIGFKWSDIESFNLSDLLGSQSFRIRWRNEGGDWGQWRTYFTDGRSGKGSVYWLKRLGIYVIRQYEIVHDDKTGFIFIELEEEVELIR